MTKAVVDGRLHHTSPTQIRVFDECQRRWFLDKVGGVAEETTPEQSAGTSSHGDTESHLLSGTPIPDGSMADLVAEGYARGYLYEGQDRHVEVPTTGLEILGVPVDGRIDLWLPDGPIHIVDWKTTSDIKRYAKKAVDILTDVQMITYGAWGVGVLEQAGGKVPFLDAALAYAQRPKPDRANRKHLWVTQRLSADQIRRQFDGPISTSVREMQNLAGRDPADFGTVPAVFSRGTCRAYNRLCPAAGWCGEEALRAAGYSTLPAGMSRPGETSVSKIEVPAVPALTVVPPTLNVPEGSLILFVDCAPSKALVNIPVLYLEDEIARRTPAVMAEIRATEPGLVPEGAVDVAEVKFARGKGAMVASFRRTPLTGYVCARNTGLAAEIVEVLTSQAGLVIRGN